MAYGDLKKFDCRNLPAVEKSKERNPCIRLYGWGPKETTCKACVYLDYYQPGKNRFYKCQLRRVSASSATDHRQGWPACAKFEPKPKL